MAETVTSTSPDIGAGQKCVTESAAGAIGILRGTVVLAGSGALAMTLAAPTAGVDDGKEIEIIDSTGQAHTVTTPTNGLNGNHHIATFDGTVGAVLYLTAYNGVWWGGRQTGITLS